MGKGADASTTFVVRKTLPETSLSPNYKLILPYKQVLSTAHQVIDRQIRLLDANNRSWRVRISLRNNGGKQEFFLTGWHAVVKDCSLLAGEKIKLWLTPDTSCLHLEISSRQPRWEVQISDSPLEFAESLLEDQDFTPPSKRQRCQGNALMTASCVPRSVRCEQPEDLEQGFNLEHFLAVAEANITQRVMEGKRGQRSLSFGAIPASSTAEEDWRVVEGLFW